MLKSMFSFGVFAVLLNNALAISEEQKAQIQTSLVRFGTACLKDHPLALDDVTSISHKLVPEDDNANCFLACIFKNLEIFDDKGTLSHTTALESAKTVFKDEEELKNVEEFLTACAKVNEEVVDDDEQGCARAKLAFACYVDNYKKFNFDLSF